MEFKRFENDYVVRLNKGENVIESLKKLCKEENIKLAEITGLGASDKVEIDFSGNSLNLVQPPTT